MDRGILTVTKPRPSNKGDPSPRDGGRDTVRSPSGSIEVPGHTFCFTFTSWFVGSVLGLEGSGVEGVPSG